MQTNAGVDFAVVLAVGILQVSSPEPLENMTNEIKPDIRPYHDARGH